MKTMSMLMIVLITVGSVGAGFVPLSNPSFENPALNEHEFVYDVDHNLSDYGWTADNDPIRTWMIYRPRSTDVIQPTDGQNWMQLTRSGQTKQISQITTNYTIEDNKIYRVMIDVTQRENWGSDSFVLSILYAARDGAQNRTTGYTLHNTGLIDVPKNNMWSTVSYEWDSTGSPLVGQNFDLVIAGRAIIDNVRIEIIPEPSTILILASGGLCTLLSKKRMKS